MVGRNWKKKKKKFKLVRKKSSHFCSLLFWCMDKGFLLPILNCCFWNVFCLALIPFCGYNSRPSFVFAFDFVLVFCFLDLLIIITVVIFFFSCYTFCFYFFYFFLQSSFASNCLFEQKFSTNFMLTNENTWLLFFFLVVF